MEWCSSPGYDLLTLKAIAANISVLLIFGCNWEYFTMYNRIEFTKYEKKESQEKHVSTISIQFTTDWFDHEKSQRGNLIQ